MRESRKKLCESKQTNFEDVVSLCGGVGAIRKGRLGSWFVTREERDNRQRRGGVGGWEGGGEKYFGKSKFLEGGSKQYLSFRWWNQLDLYLTFVLCCWFAVLWIKSTQPAILYGSPSVELYIGYWGFEMKIHCRSRGGEENCASSEWQVPMESAASEPTGCRIGS